MVAPAFGNDTTNDWAYELEDVGATFVVETALTHMLDVGDDYLDASETEEAMAAFEVLAHLLGRPRATATRRRSRPKWRG